MAESEEREEGGGVGGGVTEGCVVSAYPLKVSERLEKKAQTIGLPADVCVSDACV